MKKLTVTGRRWLLSIHILFSMALVGHVMVDLTLIITAMNTNQIEFFRASYTSIGILNIPFAPISAFGTVITGILLCIYTNWGLFKHHWIIAKDILTIIVIVIGAAGLPGWTSRILSIISSGGFEAVQSPAFTANNQKLFVGLSVQFALLAIINIISIFKPTRAKKRRLDERGLIRRP